MTGLIASVQTQNDIALPSLGYALLLVVTALIIVAAIYAPDIHAAWQRARRVMDEMPEPTVPRQLTDRNSRTPTQEQIR